MTTEQILQHIREVCGLKRLEFGCEFVYKNPYYKTKDRYVITGLENFGKKSFTVIAAPLFNIKKRGRSIEDIHKFDERVLTSDFEIIGLPVHLENLLYAIRDKDITISMRSSYGYGSLFFNENSDNEIEYDLTKTVKQNLTENTELRELIISLIK